MCVKKEEFTEAQLDGLNQKLRAIEKWAEETNHFETHFFIADIDDARRNHFGAADKESAGSALGKLLKEEFYRTHTVLAGQAPLWRIMPPNISDEEYEGFRKLASTSYDIDTNSYADMGNAQRITLEEAFGAALWQLNKALGSPFKSAMKMALIEDYMDPASDSVLLCDHLKETLARIASKPVAKNAQGKAEAEPHTIEELAERVHVDGYVLMFNRISDYYQRKARMELLGILRKCFYLKAGTSITGLDDPLREKTPKKDMIAEIVQGWGWGNDEIADLNDYKKWPFEKSVALGKQVNGFIVDSYKRLSQSGATEKTRINPTDITVLGRKLFTFYSKKDNKIGFLPKSFEESLHQDDLTFAYVPIPNKEGIWKVYRGNISPSEIQKNGTEDQLLLKSANLPEVLVWLVINGVWSRDTSFNLIAKNVPIPVAEVQDLLSQLLGFFPPVRVDALSNEALLRESEIQKTMVLVNFGELKQGGKITRLDVTYVTSWGEIFYRRAPGDISTSSVIQFCLNYLPQRDSVGEGTFKDSLKIYLPSGRAGQSERLVFREIERLVHEAANFFFSKPLPPDSIRTYIFQDEPRVYSLTLEEKKILRNQYLNIDECFLKLPRGGFRKNHVLLSASPTKLLPHQALASHLEEGVVQVFAFDDGLLARIYVSDELGGTSAFDMPRKEWAHFQGKFFLFLESVLAELAEEPHRVQEKLPLPELVFYDITKKGTYQDHFDITNVTEAARASSIKSAHGERLTAIETAAPGEGKRILEFQTGGSNLFKRGTRRENFSDRRRPCLQKTRKQRKISHFY